MSTAPSARPPAPTQPRQGPAPGGAGMAVPALDPIKLFKKYQWILVIASCVGVGVGLALHIALLKFYPTYRATAIFQCFGPQAGPATSDVARGDRDEFERFMSTQALVIKSDVVLQKFANDPRLEREAPKWTRQFWENDRYNPSLAIENIKDRLKVRVVAGSQFIDMSLGWRTKEDTAAVVGLMRQSYLDVLMTQTSAESQKRKDSLQRIIQDLTREFERLQGQKRQLISDSTLDSLDQRYNETSAALGQLQERGIQVRFDLESVRDMLANYEAELNSPAGPNYPDELRAQVDTDPIMGNARSLLSSFEGQLKSLQQNGFGPQHREIVLLRAQIDAQKAQIEQLKQTLLADRFAATIDGARRAKSGLEAQQLDADNQGQQMKARLTEITTIQSQVRDLDLQIDRVVASISERKDELNNLQGIDRLATNARVVTYQTETVPETMDFPKIYIMIPVGYVLTVGAVCLWIFLREILEQRIKGPADISLIPRLKLLGMIASTAEDPVQIKAIETVVRDQPTSILAENYRQLRAPLAKRMSTSGHKVLAIVGGMPGSGSTSVTANLALAFAMAESRVLVIDANLRRPSIHKIFGKSEGPGLSEVLARTKSLSEVVQAASKPGEPDIVSVGADASNVYERLGAQTMADFLDQARASYDIILVDVAPAVVSGDCLAIANRADASLLVVKAMSEKRGLVARLRNELSDSKAEFLGVIINGVRSSAGGYFKRNIRATADYQNLAR